MVRRSVQFLLLLALFVPAGPSRSQDVISQQALYDRFKANAGKDAPVAYEAAKEYLRRYPEDKSENAQYMKRFVAAYEKVTGPGTLPSTTSESSTSSKIPADKHYELGQSHIRLEEWSEAEEEFRQALLLEPNNVQYRKSLAYILLYKQKKMSEAEDQYRNLVANSPEDAGYRFGLARSLANQRKWQESEDEYRKGIRLSIIGQLNHHHEDAELAHVLFQTGKVAEGERIYFERFKSPYVSESTYLQLGKDYIELGRRADAEYALAVGLYKSCPIELEHERCQSFLQQVSATLGRPNTEISTVEWVNPRDNDVITLQPGGRFWPGKSWQKVGEIVILVHSNGALNVGVLRDDRIILAANITPKELKERVEAGDREYVSLDFALKTYPERSLAAIGKSLYFRGSFEKAFLFLTKGLSTQWGYWDRMQAMAAVALILARKGQWKESELTLKDGRAICKGSSLCSMELWNDALAKIKSRQIPSEDLLYIGNRN